ncbi:MAG: hypothetical protein KKA73_02745 [Chloroflexi bacterium]|nr:hypothetical protein [Chloroflexota bacterium]MBU1746582.1 hypothetical protein [Chloroflexota bacterium]MBU1877995.1 hypothetical protein [Chloroflexota bacterium]
MNHADRQALTEEEKLVAELGLLGIRYLSRQTLYQAYEVRPPENLLADLVQQPCARVRVAIIAVLLAHPELAVAVPAALEQLQPHERLSLQWFYVAAMLLQREYASRLRPFLTTQWQWLPDLFSVELGLPAGGTPRERLILLGHQQRRQTQTAVNWAGTYEQVAHKLIRRWEREVQWNR